MDNEHTCIYTQCEVVLKSSFWWFIYSWWKILWESSIRYYLWWMVNWAIYIIKCSSSQVRIATFKYLYIYIQVNNCWIINWHTFSIWEFVVLFLTDIKTCIFIEWRCKNKDSFQTHKEGLLGVRFDDERFLRRCYLVWFRRRVYLHVWPKKRDVWSRGMENRSQIQEVVLVCIRQRRSGLKVFGKEMRRVVGVKSKRRGW